MLTPPPPIRPGRRGHRQSALSRRSYKSGAIGLAHRGDIDWTDYFLISSRLTTHAERNCCVSTDFGAIIQEIAGSFANHTPARDHALAPPSCPTTCRHCDQRDTLRRSAFRIPIVGSSAGRSGKTSRPITLAAAELTEHRSGQLRRCPHQSRRRRQPYPPKSARSEGTRTHACR